MARRGRSRRAPFPNGLGRGSVVKTGDLEESQLTGRARDLVSDLKFEELYSSIDDEKVADKLNCEIVPTEDDLAGALPRLRDPYLQAVPKGAAEDDGARLPKSLMGNRDTRRGLQLSNEEEWNEELVFTIEDVVGERRYWDNALI
ncbi:hypothetical protein Dimus_030565, partial [Dionaea muscipula]